MAMSASVLSALMQTKLLARGFTEGEYESWRMLCDALAEAVVEHITQAARAVGTDSRGDSHDLPIV
jgi:hypothetical protein